ncbi:UNVERIFIED_CONTAM: hypothetical protein H355_011851 [Colinus virginianus]|nr:hypothetical protein H355_011851 [Colinus virginianus]
MVCNPLEQWLAAGSDITALSSLENQQRRRNLRLRGQRQSDSCVLSSDDEDETRDNDVYVTDKVSRELGPLEDETASSNGLRDAETIAVYEESPSENMPCVILGLMRKESVCYWAGMLLNYNMGCVNVSASVISRVMESQTASKVQHVDVVKGTQGSSDEMCHDSSVQIGDYVALYVSMTLRTMELMDVLFPLPQGLLVLLAVPSAWTATQR